MIHINAQTFRALSDPCRLNIVDLLLNGPLPVGEIAEKLDLKQPQTSKHLRTLCDAGLVEVKPAANRRIYNLRLEPFQEINRWLDSYRCSWEARMDNLDDYLHVLQGKKPLN